MAISIRKRPDAKCIPLGSNPSREKRNLSLPVLLSILGILSFSISGLIVYRSLSGTRTTSHPISTPFPTPTETSDETALIASCQEKTVCHASDTAVGCANPASVFCTCMGGTLAAKENDQGQYNTCTINGIDQEEWEYYRSKTNQPAAAYECPTTDWVDCMPGPDTDGIKSKCTTDYLTWAKNHCPNFKGAAY